MTTKKTVPKKKKKPDRKPRTLFNEEKDRQLKAILRLKPTREDCAAFLGVEVSTVDKYIKRTYHCTFSEFREQNMVHTRFMLIRTAIKKAESGDNCMLIFCLKNICNWSNDPVMENNEKEKILTLQYNIEKKAEE